MENLDDFTSDITTTGVLTADGISATGNIDFESDEDWFALDVLAGEQYIINLTGISIFEPNFDINLFDSSGNFQYGVPGVDALVFTASETGTVFIEAESFVGTGEYNLTASVLEDDFSNDVTTTGILTADGTAVTGNMDFSDDFDWFALEVVAGEQYTVNLIGGSIPEFDFELNLFDGSGNFLIGEFGTGQLTFTASETGIVFVETGTFPLSGTSEYTLTANVLEDDFADNVGTTGVLTADGAAVTGNIDFANDEDWFALEVVQGEFYTINFTSSLTATADVELHDSNGNFLQDGSDVLSFAAQTTGTVYISADVFGSSTGSYELTANVVEAPEDDFAADVNTIAVLLTEDGSASSGNIDFDGDTDWFAVDVIVGETYTINISSDTISSFNLDLNLYDSSGFFLDGEISSQPLTFTATETGTFFVEADVFGSATGSYDLTANIVVDDFTADITTTGVLIADGSAVTGNADFAGDADWFALEVVAGELYAIDLAGVTISEFDFALNLYDGSGNFLSNTFGPNTLVFTAAETGTVFVEASALPFSLTGEYNLTANIVEDDFAADVTTTGVLTAGGTAVVGNIDVSGDVDWFALEVVAGELYAIDLAGVTISESDINLNLYDGSGNFLSNAFGADLLVFTAAETGTVFVEASASTFSQTGEYNLTANIVEDDFAADVTTTGVLTVGGTAVVGNIDVSGDADWFALEVVAGELYTIDLAGVTITEFHINLNLYDGSGNFLSNASGGNSLGFTAAETGTVFVEANALSFSSTGEYNLTANIVVDDFAADVTTTGVLTADGAAAAGNVDFAGDADWFALNVVAGEQYIIDLTGVSISEFDFDLSLFDSSGTVLSNAFGADPLVFTASETGTVFIGANAQPFSSTGEYNLTANILVDDFAADITTTGVLTNDGVVSTGVLEINGDDDWFELTITEAQTLQINLTGDSLSDPYLYLYDSDGNLIALNDDGGPGLDSQLTFDFDAGTYYVSARAFADSRSGTYELTAQEVVPPPPPTITDAVDWGTYLPGAGNGTTQINVYFVPGAQSINVEEFGISVDTLEFTQYEIDQFNLAFDEIESYIDVEFVIVTDPDQADFTLAINTDDPGLLGFMFPQGETQNDDGLGVFNRDGIGWDEEGGGGLERGGFGYVTVVHELGHGLGLAHPHDNGGGSTILPGVSGFSSQTDTGDFDLNQSVFTILSYVDGWALNPAGSPGTFDYGYQATFAPLDIAVLQEAYGANTSTNTGNTVYELESLNQSGTAFETIFDNSGTDTILSISDSDAVINLNDASLEFEIGGGGSVSNVAGIHGGFTIANGSVIENATSGSGNDFLIGNEANNTLNASLGDDVLDGQAGDDLLNGGGGDDFLIGGAGDDILNGRANDDVLVGGSGADVINGGTGVDLALYIGSTGAVTVDLDAGTGLGAEAEGDTFVDIENVSGSDFDDRLTGDIGNNVLAGFEGDDRLLGLDGDDTLNGHAGADYFSGGAGEDSISGGDGDDRAFGGADNDLVNGEAGDDDLRGGTGDDVINGGEGVDLLVGQDGNDALNGGDGSDTLIGGADDDILNGDTGNDTLAGQSGDDTINGGDGEDQITGKFGDDTIDGGADNDNIFAGSGEDLVFGGAGDDTIRGEGQDDELHGGDGDDTLTGGGGRDAIFGDAGNDTIFGQGGLDTLHGGGGDDTIGGGDGNDVMLGQGGNDTLNGGNGHDEIFGNSGDDILNGNAGNDILNGGFGNDILNGGTGNDTFVFGLNYGDDTVNGFSNDEDTLNFFNSSLGVSSIAELLDPANGYVSQTDANTVTFDFGNGDILTVNGSSAFTIADLVDDVLLG